MINFLLENPLEGNNEDDSVRSSTRSSGSLPYTTSDNVYITISGNLPATQRDLVYSSWYFNGLRSLPAALSVQRMQKLPTGVTQSMTIHNPTSLHAGTYEAVLQLDPVSYLRQFGCSDEYSNFIVRNSRTGVYRIVVDQFAMDLDYYGESEALGLV